MTIDLQQPTEISSVAISVNIAKGDWVFDARNLSVEVSDDGKIDREELAALLNISENQLSYITNVSVGSGLIRCSGNIVDVYKRQDYSRGTKADP